MQCPVLYDSKSKIWFNPSDGSQNPKSLAKEFDPKKFVGDVLLEKFEKIDPSKILLINYNTNEYLTAGDIRYQSIACAKNLLKMGIKQGDIVLFYASLNVQMTPVVFGMYMIGAVSYPMDSKGIEDDLDYAFTFIKPTLILCDNEEYDEVVETVRKHSLQHTVKGILSFEPRDDGRTVQNVLLNYPSEADLKNFKATTVGDASKSVLALLSSSGSTGRPKIITLTHALVLYAQHYWWPLESTDTVFVSSHLRWISQTMIMIQSIVYGGFRRILTNTKRSGELVAKIIEKYKVTHIFILPTLTAEVLRDSEKYNINIDSLRYIMSGGERTPIRTTKEAKRIVPKCQFFRCYGMSEIAGVISTTEHVRENYDNSGGYLQPKISVKIVDENDVKLGPNEKGQICLKARYMFPGYWNDEVKTDQAFDKDGWLLTGDYGYFDNDNLLYIVDRYSDIIKYNNNLIFPSSIETILNEHPKVSVGIVVGVMQEDNCIPAAFIKLRNEIPNTPRDCTLLKEEIYEFLKERISENQMPTGGIYFVTQFPLTYNEKVNRKELKMIAKDLIKESL